MRSKTIINSKGERQATRIEIPIEGAGGELGQRAVINLTSLIAGLKKHENRAGRSNALPYNLRFCYVL